MGDIDLTAIDDAGLVGLYGNVMVELRRREIVRSGNNPVADLAEALVATHFGVEPEPQSNKGFDVRTKVGERIQVKSLRRTQKGRTSLSAIRSDEFDSIYVVIFGLDMQLEEVLVVAKPVYEEFRSWSETWKAYRITVTNRLRQDPRVERLGPDQFPM